VNGVNNGMNNGVNNGVNIGVNNGMNNGVNNGMDGIHSCDGKNRYSGLTVNTDGRNGGLKVSGRNVCRNESDGEDSGNSSGNENDQKSDGQDSGNSSGNENDQNALFSDFGFDGNNRVVHRTSPDLITVLKWLQKDLVAIKLIETFKEQLELYRESQQNNRHQNNAQLNPQLNPQHQNNPQLNPHHQNNPQVRCALPGLVMNERFRRMQIAQMRGDETEPETDREGRNLKFD
jgi:hypothetical protein